MNKEKVEALVRDIMVIEKESMKKRFDSANGNNEKF